MLLLLSRESDSEVGGRAAPAVRPNATSAFAGLLGPACHAKAEGGTQPSVAKRPQARF
jgi:hypothetical protein